MDVSANTTQIVSKLFSKTIGRSIKGGTTLSGANNLSILTPKNAEKFDFFNGIGKKGKFQLYSFKDKEGNTIEHYTRYITDNGSVKDVVTDLEKVNGVLNTTRKTVTNGIEEQVEYSSVLPQLNQNNNEIVFSKSFMTMTPKGDAGGIELLQKGKKPIGLSYKYNWQGAPNEIEYKNTLGRRLDITEEEGRYLPFIPRKYVIIEQDGQPAFTGKDFTKERTQEKVGLAQIIQEKLHNIEGIMPRAKAVKTEDLHIIKTSGKTLEQWKLENGFVPQGESIGNGQINIATDVGNNSDGVMILDLISHEMQHGADAISMYRGGGEASDEALRKVGRTPEEYNKAHESDFNGQNIQEYINKVIETKGLAPKGSPEYDEAVKLYEMNFSSIAAKDLTSIEQHDLQPLEKRAIEREKQQVNFYSFVGGKVSDFLGSFLG